MYYVLTIESIEVLNTAGDGQIFGEVMLQFSDLKPIYRRTISNPETKFAGDFLTLTGPSVEYECDVWQLYVSLYDGDDQHEIAVGEISFHTVPMGSFIDQSLTHTFTGKYGAVSVRYNTLRQPVLSNIAVVLLGEEEGVARVFGTITAYQHLSKEEVPTPVVLFRKSVEESVPVLSGGAIPMDRCVVGLYSGSHITVEVELRRAGTGIGAGDELIGSGSVDFKHINYKRYVSESESESETHSESETQSESEAESEIISGGCGSELRGSCGRQIQVSVRFHY